MSAFITRLIDMSLAGGILILLAVILRLVFRRAPKRVALMLWAVVALRLLCPVFINGGFAVMPRVDDIAGKLAVNGEPTGSEPAFETSLPTKAAPIGSVEATGSAITPAQTSSAEHPSVTAPPTSTAVPIVPAVKTEPAPLPTQKASVPAAAVTGSWQRIAFFVWLAGAVCMFCYAMISFARLKSRLSTAIRLRDNVYQSEYVSSPFLLGVLHPRIYVPFGLDGESLEYALAHERAHISRCDHIVKPIGFAVLSLHWFNPLCWLAYALFCRDIELACDERVTASFTEAERAGYSNALLDLSSGKAAVSACPLTFGEGNTAFRIKRVLSHKRPLVWLVPVCVLICLLLAGCSLFGGKSDPPSGSPAPTETAAAEPTEAPTTEPSTEPTKEPRPVHYEGILPYPDWQFVYDAEGGLLFKELGNPLFHAVAGENKDCIFGDYDFTPVLLEGRDEPVSFLTAADHAVLMSGTNRAIFFCGSESGDPRDGYWHSLIYIVAFSDDMEEYECDLMLCGSNPKHTFGDFDYAPLDEVIFEGAVGIGCDDTHVCVVNKAGELYVWDVNAPTEDGSPVLYAENVDPNWLIGTRAYLTTDGCLHFDASFDPADRGKNVITKQNVAAIRGGETGVLVLDDDGRLTYMFFDVTDGNALKEREVGGAVVDFGRDECGNGVWFVNSEGDLFALEHPEDMDSAPVKLFSGAASGGVCGGMAWALTEYGTLYYGGTDKKLPVLAEDVIGAVGVESGCVYIAQDFKLHFYKAFLPDGFEGEVCDMDVSKSIMRPIVNTYEGTWELYERTARAILAGKSVEDIAFTDYGQRVYFHLEDDGLKVYSSIKIVSSTPESMLSPIVTYGYDGLLATLPGELAEAANESLYSFTDKYLWSDMWVEGSDLVYSGFWGGDYVVFVTEDDSMQDLQCQAIFRFDGGEWKEVEACPGMGGENGSASIPHTISGACVSGGAAYFCYYTKFCWDEETGWRYPYVYRTADEGRTWNRLDIELPEEYAETYPYAMPLSPVFEGSHGVIILGGLVNERMAWLETFDNGLTWEFNVNG